MAAATPRPAPWFTFEAEVRAVPATPTHCACGVVLEPLRRYAGLCKACVARRAAGLPPPAAPTARLQSQMVFVRYVYRKRTGHNKREKFAEVRCSCGRKRVLYWHLWHARPPMCCNRCRLRGVEAHGFEAEHGR